MNSGKKWFGRRTLLAVMGRKTVGQKTKKRGQERLLNGERKEENSLGTQKNLSRNRPIKIG